MYFRDHHRGFVVLVHHLGRDNAQHPLVPIAAAQQHGALLAEGDVLGDLGLGLAEDAALDVAALLVEGEQLLAAVERGALLCGGEQLHGDACMGQPPCGGEVGCDPKDNVSNGVRLHRREGIHQGQ